MTRQDAIPTQRPPAVDGPGDLDGLLSARRVRELLDCPDRTLRRWIAGGLFPPADLRIGTSLRWRRSTVQGFIQGNTELAKPRKPLRFTPRTETRAN